MKRRKYLIAGAVALGLLTGCGSKEAVETETAKEKETITIAYQSSVGYAPLVVMKEQGLIEKQYGDNLEVVWTEMNNGSQINEGLTAGSIDVGSMGVPVALTGIKAGSPYRIAAALSAQPYSILTNQDDIQSLSDIGADDQIAITNINSQPHILLAMAAKKEFGDARKLDNNLTVLSNADGFNAMVSKAVNCHMVISPYNFMEIKSEDTNIHEIEIDASVWNPENTALVTVATEKLYKDHKDIYDAYVTALNEAMEFIAANPEKTAEMVAKGYDASPEEIQEWITDPRSSYSTELHGVIEMANFMEEEGFIEEAPKSVSEIAFEGIKGE